MKNNKFTTAQLTLLGLMIAILLVMSYTPLGYLNIGPLAISFNVIPVAISAIVLGPVGGAVAGGVFGLTSFLQCIGVGGTSAMGVMLFSINPFLAFVQRFIPRLLDGICLGYNYQMYTEGVGAVNGSHELVVSYQSNLDLFKKGRNRHKSVRWL